MRLFPLPIRLALLCLTLALPVACGLSPDADERSESQGGGGGEGGGGGGEGGDGGTSESPGHCASKTWSAVLKDEGVYSVTTDHYHLELEIGSKERAEELGRLAEAAWLAFTAYFEGSPEIETSQRLSVSLFSSRESFQEALAAIGANSPDAGGYYAPSTRTAYLYEQPNPYYTNVLYLHEMAHQFHYLARTSNQNVPFWYAEGLAEYLSRHDWDGSCVRLGVVPMLSWEDLPSRALDSVSKSGLDTSAIISGRTKASREESWSIFAYLERGEGGAKADAFASYRALMDAGSPADPSVFESLLGPITAFDLEVAGWLPTAQEPLSPIYREWMHVAPGTVRSLRTGLLSLARVKQSHSVFEVTAAGKSSGGQAGVLAGFTDTENFVAYLVGDDLRISEFKNVNGNTSWEVVGPAVSPNDDGSFTWRVSHTGLETQIDVNGISHRAAAGFQPVSGPAAYDSDVTFTNMKWR